MKKKLSNLLDYNKSLDAESRGNEIEFLIDDDLLSIRGGDKEYKPIYDDDDSFSWKQPSLLFDLL